MNLRKISGKSNQPPQLQPADDEDTDVEDVQHPDLEEEDSGTLKLGYGAEVSPLLREDV